jgi:pyrroline-5-carboxylate reductase
LWQTAMDRHKLSFSNHVQSVIMNKAHPLIHQMNHGKEHLTMKLGFIGAGNMGGAIIRGVLKANVLQNTDILVSDIHEAALERLQAECGVGVTTQNSDVARHCDVVILAVKPYICKDVLKQLKDAWRGDGQIVVSIVAGWLKDHLSKYIPASVKVLNTMPNTPAMVGEGVTAFNAQCPLTKDEFALIENLFTPLGQVVYVTEAQLSAVTGVSGSGPAYVYMFIEALADGGVKYGLPRDVAMRLAAQTVIGAGTMVRETRQHPGALKDAVCSPSGTTIAAVHALEHSAFRAAVIDAVEAGVQRAREIAQENKE